MSKNRQNSAAAADTSNDQVVVGCKLPQGLHIHIDQKRVTLAGANASNIIGGYGFTRVDRSFMETWLSRHKDYVPVQRGLIFIQEDDADAAGQAEEQSDVRSGFEGLNPDAPAPSVKPAETEE
jgi:hypothetical protein